MPQILISGEIINFPNSGASPNWAPAVIQFAQAVESALESVVGPFDITPQVYVMSSNVNTDVNVPNLAFPVSNVRGAFIRYSVYRQTDNPLPADTTLSESGTITTTYNPNGTTNNKWAITREYVGDAQITFTITDTGQVTFSTTSLAGTNHVGRITYAAQALLNA